MNEPWLLRWGSVVGLWLCFMLLTGGLSTPSPLATTAHFGVGAALLIAALWRLRRGFPNRFALFAWLLFAVGIALVGAQLVPLPPSVWTTLPGRGLVRDTLAMTGPELPWLPLTLAPKETTVTLLSILPIFAGFLAALTMKSRDYFVFALIFICMVVIAVVVGLLQATGRAPAALYFYNKPDVLAATGFFGNRNFLAALIFSSLPFLAVVASSIQRQFKIYPVIVIIFTLIYMAMMLGGLAVVGSRGGVTFAMPAVLLTLLFVYRSPRDASTLKRSGYVSIATVGALLLISQVSMVGILRLLDSDPLEDFRSTIYEVSMVTAKAFWPVGSGFGSFVNVYQMHEGPSAIVDRFINAAHNDWMQLIIEGGAAAMVLVLGFAVMFLFAAIRTLRYNFAADEQSTTVRAALLSVALLSAHAFFDFGLRTPALLSFFAIACGLACLSGKTDQRYRLASSRSRAAAERNEPSPMQPAKRDPSKPFFKTPNPR